jgi:HPt (histidine-containing phosphotransfer) domain-containing protein
VPLPGQGRRFIGSAVATSASEDRIRQLNRATAGRLTAHAIKGEAANVSAERLGPPPSRPFWPCEWS